ncbi:MAG: hypothetical protein QOH62_487 [Solirubrobacteraceae bacterium]|nr:hypothetical protein [Solirubrobacteraceae bacterium]
MSTPKVLAAAGVMLALAAPLTSPAAARSRPPVAVSPAHPVSAAPITLTWSAPAAIPRGKRLRLRLTTIGQQDAGSCTALAAANAKRVKKGARLWRARFKATLPTDSPRWCAGPAQAEAQLVDAHGKALGAAYVLPIAIAASPGDPALGVPVTIGLLDGSTLTTAAGTFGLSGAMNGLDAGPVRLSSATTLQNLTGSLAIAPGAPCTTVDLAPPDGTLYAPSAVTLESDGVVFATLHLVLHECGDPVDLLLAGKVGDRGLSSLAMDSFAGPVSAHLVVKVDLSGG